MIYIDFQGGAHGNFLEFVCNKFLAGVPCPDTPFNQYGASHKKKYYSTVKFQSDHFFEKDIQIRDSKVISIQIQSQDLLRLSSISLLRAGDFGIDNDALEKNTFNKLNIPEYRWVLETILNSFFVTQVRDSYEAVRDPSWPQVNNVKEFQALPEWIRDECINQHQLFFLELSPDKPDCSRHVLREFFKIGFKYPEQSGFMTQQQRMTYDDSNQVYIFPFACFYDTKEFVEQMYHLADWTGFELASVDQVQDLHVKFLDNQPYKNSKKFCDDLLEKFNQRHMFAMPKLDLLQESYLSARLEFMFNIELPTQQWFAHSSEIYAIDKS